MCLCIEKPAAFGSGGITHDNTRPNNKVQWFNASPSDVELETTSAVFYVMLVLNIRPHTNSELPPWSFKNNFVEVGGEKVQWV